MVHIDESRATLAIPLLKVGMIKQSKKLAALKLVDVAGHADASKLPRSELTHSFLPRI